LACAWFASIRCSLAAGRIVPRSVGVSLSGPPLLAETSLPLSTNSATVYALLVPPKNTMSSSSCKRQNKKITPRGVGVSLSGTPLLAETSLRCARPSGTSLSGTLMLADASLHGVSLGGTLGLADALLRGASLSATLVLADANLRGVSLSGTLQLADATHIFLKYGT
jgi:hypothetical protein